MYRVLARPRATQSLRKQLSEERAKIDHRGLVIDLLAYVTMGCRASQLPEAPWSINLYHLAVVCALLALLVWNAAGRASYLRWRSGVQVVIRLWGILSPINRWVRRRIINNPPAWWAGGLASPFNAFTFLTGVVMGQSYVTILMLLAASHVVPLWIHLPLQLVCTQAVVWENGALCASASIDNEVTRGYMHLLHGALGMLGLVLPLADYPGAGASPTVECKRVLAFFQYSLGFATTSLVLAYVECSALRRHKQELRARRDAARRALRARQDAQRHAVKAETQHRAAMPSALSMDRAATAARTLSAPLHFKRSQSGAIEPLASGLLDCPRTESIVTNDSWDLAQQDSTATLTPAASLDLSPVGAPRLPPSPRDVSAAAAAAGQAAAPSPFAAALPSAAGAADRPSSSSPIAALNPAAPQPARQQQQHGSPRRPARLGDRVDRWLLCRLEPLFDGPAAPLQLVGWAALAGAVLWHAICVFGSYI